MIRLSSKAETVEEETQEQWIDTIFGAQSYLINVYPGDTRKLAGIVFRITNAQIEYFHLGVNPIFRESYTIGKGHISFKGYQITDACIGCGNCVKNCPQMRNCKPGLVCSRQKECTKPFFCAKLSIAAS